jgi:hypothetical protein
MLFIFNALVTLAAFVAATSISVLDDLPTTLPFNGSNEAMLTDAEIHANVLAKLSLQANHHVRSAGSFSSKECWPAC